MYKLTVMMDDDGEQVEVNLADQHYDEIVKQVKNPDDAEIVRIDSDVPGLAEWLTKETAGADIYLLAEMVDEFDGIYGAYLATDSDFIEAINQVLEHWEECDVEQALAVLHDARSDYGSEEVVDVLNVLGVEYGLDALERGNFVYCRGIVDDEDLGEYLIDQSEEGVAGVEFLTSYLDLRDLGQRLIDDNDYDEQEVIEDHGTLEQFAEYMVDEGFVNQDVLSDYFDYEMYGKDCYSDFTGGYGDYGFVYTE